MASLFKFGYLGPLKEALPFEYDDTYSIEPTTGPSRLVIAPRDSHIELIRALLHRMAEPFYVLYVFLVPRTDQQPAGRYQSPEELSREQLEAFLARFEKYFEGDGRHDVWFRSATDSSLLVYDQHNVIYAYGHLDSFKELLDSRGFHELPRVVFPAPHVHNYHAEFDADQNALLEYWHWNVSPLKEQDER